MSAAEALADGVTVFVWPIIALALLCIPTAVVGLVVEQRRKWPHGRMRTCNDLGCACQRSSAAALKKRIGRLL